MVLTRVLICASGSVAALKVPEIAVELSKYELIDFRIVCSQSSLHFIRNAEIYNPVVWSQFQGCGGMSLVFTDDEEWTIWQKIGDPVLHIDLSQWADLVIVAPASADILAKINSGISDTLLLSILRAWNFQKPCILCPAMNTMMWEHPVTGKTLEALKATGWTLISPVSKTLACNVVGMGAMAHVVDIISSINQAVEALSVRRRHEGIIVTQLKTDVAKLHGDWRQKSKREFDQNRQFQLNVIFCLSLIPLSAYAFHRMRKQ